ncbi:hypothetical protein LX97_02744 [Nonlabens dokdonensis]|jgi:hypothetical protein|uniref:Uncharacterized protein n=2 Tax=Nonlabens dokdonensis TaxID=328515 RepID=L7W9Q5_NONDD|nr:hypothetical protein [Nonlabens dokdonensis]AGC78415.1 hypothetical protein DDD_3288 [Nonlabens dokdonensis DSW-6]PZX38163.1 hypothetical protein LX97_02744 [Nonlabens dokdonensis]
MIRLSHFNKNILSLLSIFILLGCNSDDSIEENEEILINNPISDYWDDAREIYQLEIIDDINHFNYALEDLDSLQILEIAKNIRSVDQLSIPEQDSIFNQYQIKPNTGYRRTRLTFKAVDNGSIGAQETINLILPSSNANELYNFYSTNPFVFTQSAPIITNWVDIEFLENKNQIYLKNRLENISFIPQVIVSPSIAGTSSKIKFERFPNFNIITFRMGWGDCFSGCITKRYWKFETTEQSAVLIDSYFANDF